MFARDLIDHSLAEVRLTQGLRNHEPIAVAEFVEELSASAVFAAVSRSITLLVEPVEDGLIVEGDRQLLAAVLINTPAERNRGSLGLRPESFFASSGVRSE